MSNAATDLASARLDLVMAVEGTDNGDFPGSRGWKRHNDACKALAAFDAAHPEIAASIQAAHASEMAGRYQD